MQRYFQLLRKQTIRIAKYNIYLNQSLRHHSCKPVRSGLGRSFLSPGWNRRVDSDKNTQVYLIQNQTYFIFSNHLLNNSNLKNTNMSKSSGTFENTGKQSKRKMRIYTKTGDKGESSLFTNERRAKDDPIFDALGNTDELSAAIGIAREHCIQVNNGLDKNLSEIQSRLIDIGAAIATPESSTKASENKRQRVHFDMNNVKILESWIDELDETLPALRNFILPSGGFASAHLHLSRAICRRCERSLIILKRNNDLQESVSVYINRLSDYLFMAARHASHFEKKPEIAYKKPHNESKDDK